MKTKQTISRCPKCHHGRWRNVGEIASTGISDNGKRWREVEAKVVACMKCKNTWDIYQENSEYVKRQYEKLHFLLEKVAKI